MTNEAGRDPRAELPDDLFDAHPAATFVVDDDVRLLRANRAARRMVARGGTLGCVHAEGAGACGRQPECAGCVLLSSVTRVLTTGAVQRARVSMPVRTERDVAEVHLLVSAAPVLHGGERRVLLMLEDVDDPSSREPVARPIRADGHVDARDVTDLRRTIAQLAAEKDRLRVTLRSIGDGVIVTDERARITLLNGVAEALTGWSADDALGRSIEDIFRIVSEKTRAPTANPVLRALREGIVVGLANHTALIARDGTERPIADSAAPIHDGSGSTCGAVLVFRDQTREREAEDALRASEQRIRQKLEAILSPEGDLGRLELADLIDPEPLRAMMEEFNRISRIPLAIIDIRGKVLVGVGWQDICTRFHRVHPETCRSCIESDTMLTAGVPEGEIRRYRCKNNLWDVATPIVVGGHHVGNVFMGQFFHDDERVDRDLYRAQAARYGFDQGEYLAALDQVPRLDRNTVASAMAFFLRFAGMLSRASLGQLKLARALGERDRLMGSLQDSNRRLQETDRRRTEFLGVLSHELRNPLAPIRNGLYILDRAAPGSERATRAKEVIDRQVAHLTRLVDDLLDVTRISHAKIALERARIDLRDVVRKTCEDHRAVFDGRLDLNVELPGSPVWVYADGTRLSQVVGNLIQNAAKFTPDGGHVDVRVVAGADRVEIAISDDGIGIEPADLERLFEPFAQGPQGLERSHGGLGLGLALARGLVELHGGAVSAASSGRGHGATFVVTLPRADAAQA
jgi:PAS domain S-box-containing protein